MCLATGIVGVSKIKLSKLHSGLLDGKTIHGSTPTTTKPLVTSSNVQEFELTVILVDLYNFYDYGSRMRVSNSINHTSHRTRSPKKFRGVHKDYTSFQTLSTRSRMGFNPLWSEFYRFVYHYLRGEKRNGLGHQGFEQMCISL